MLQTKDIHLQDVIEDIQIVDFPQTTWERMLGVLVYLVMPEDSSLGGRLNLEVTNKRLKSSVYGQAKVFFWVAVSIALSLLLSQLS